VRVTDRGKGGARASPPARPKRIGLVKGALTQGGAERYAFEICRAIDAHRFEVEMLGFEGTGLDEQHYGRRLAAHGVTIREVLPAMPLTALHPFTWRQRLRARFRSARHRARIQALLRQYDLIALVQIESALLIDAWLPRDRLVVLHLLSHRLQYESDVYRKLRSGRRYTLICQDAGQLEEAQSMGNRIASATVVPLPVDPADFPPLRFKRREELVIATFIRISPERPLLPLFEALSELVKTTDAVLRHYGRGDSAELLPTLDSLGIRNRVTFAGHSVDMRRSLEEDGVSFAWMTAYDDSLGYASIELAAMGVPCCFYNVGRGQSPDEIRRRTGGAVNCFGSPTELAESTAAFYRDEGRYRALGSLLREFVQERHDVHKLIGQIERVYEAAATPVAEFGLRARRRRVDQLTDTRR
jgi:glycosyltransferase involved in cell wall biosynthesis